MNLKPNPRFGQSGQALLLCIIAVVIVLVVMGIVFYLFISTVQRIVPPKHDAQGKLLPIGSYYGNGGIVVGYTNGGTLSIHAVTNATFTLLMYADADAGNVITNWQNCRFVKAWTYTGWSLAQAYSDFCPSNQFQESWPIGSAPSQQFYNILVSQ